MLRLAFDPIVDYADTPRYSGLYSSRAVAAFGGEFALTWYTLRRDAIVAFKHDSSISAAFSCTANIRNYRFAPFGH